MAEETLPLPAKVHAALALGLLLNTAVSACYNLSVATGHARYPLRVNVVAALPYVTILMALVTNFGIEGAALTWVFLNLYYLVTLMPLAQKLRMVEPLWTWLSTGFLPYLAAALVSFTWAGS